MIPAIFLDRDGVINYNRADYVKSVAEFVFLSPAFPGFRRLAKLGWPIVVITNQAVIGRGMATPATVEEVHAFMCRVVQLAGGRIDGVYYCPHHPEDHCDCRKPRPGLLLQAAEEMLIDLKHSYLVGDHLSDLQAARAAGCQPIFVTTGRGNGQLASVIEQGIPVAVDLDSAARWISERIAMTSRVVS